MLLLAIDTCLPACSVAVTRDGEAVAWASVPTLRGHQELLAPMARELLAGKDLAFADLDRIGVTVGPGSFTGLRVGIAFAKGLGFALGRPTVGVGALEALAASLESQTPTAAVIDSGRGRVYLQLFAAGAAVIGPTVLEIGAAIELLNGRRGSDLVLTGPGAELLADGLPGASVLPLATPDPRAVARLAWRAPLAPPRPLYLRAPDAKAKAA
jgi:tRNA threonylcarbamoyladenosine biosynthesis protein TsaB